MNKVTTTSSEPIKHTRFLSEVRVPISVEVGTLSLSAEEVVNLTPGQAFDLIPDARRRLKLRVGEEVFAEAVLIADGEEYLLEIVSLCHEENSEFNEHQGESGRLNY